MPTESLQVSGLIPATPKTIYEAWLDGAQHSKFTGGPATVEPKVGGRYTAWGDYIRGKNVALEPYKRIIQTWRTTEFPEGAEDSRVEVLLTSRGGGETAIELNHTGVPEGDSHKYEEGWIKFYLTPMRAYFNKLKAKKAQAEQKAKDAKAAKAASKAAEAPSKPAPTTKAGGQTKPERAAKAEAKAEVDAKPKAAKAKPAAAKGEPKAAKAKVAKAPKAKPAAAKGEPKAKPAVAKGVKTGGAKGVKAGGAKGVKAGGAKGVKAGGAKAKAAAAKGVKAGVAKPTARSSARRTSR